MNDQAAPPRGRANGRRTALIVILVAFIASATTAMLAFTASHRAQKSDQTALAADTADLRGMLADWNTRVSDVQRASSADQPSYLHTLEARSAALSDWKPRTPCGEQARDSLREAADAHLRRLQRIQAGQLPGNERIDEGAALEQALGRCDAVRGRDVNI